MLAARNQRFAPAAIALAALAWPEPDATLKMLSDAAKLGHKGAFVARCGFLRTGRLGIGKQILGYLLTPFARLQYALAAWMNPFSAGVVLITTTDQLPALRSAGV